MALNIICIVDVRYHQIFEPCLSTFLLTNRDVCDKKRQFHWHDKMSKCLTIERSRSNEICKSKKINVRTFNNLWNIIRTNNGMRLSKLAKWESLTKRATTYWRTRRKHRVSSEWINNRMALVRSKYCQCTLPLPFDPLRLIFLSRRGSFVSINNVSLRVSLAKQTLLFSTRIRSIASFFAKCLVEEPKWGCVTISCVTLLSLLMAYIWNISKQLIFIFRSFF